MQTGHPKVASDFFDVAGDYRTTGKRISRMLLTGEPGQPDNYKLGYGYGSSGGGGWDSPRHRHNFEQIRYPIEGDFLMRRDEYLPAGWVAYFPESVYYGPQTKAENLTMLVLQYGGPSGYGYDSAAEIRKGTDDLLREKGGVLEGGLYKYTDENGVAHNQDASEAVHEYIRGEKMVYPPPRYHDIVVMDPAAYTWVKDKEYAGVATKMLGCFTERLVKIGFIQLNPGASFNLGTEESVELAFVKEGTVTAGGEKYDTLTAFGTKAAEGPTALTAVEETLLFYIKLPTF
jgi:hypothetical protein